MKIVHVPFSWQPEVMGGTEVYVQELVCQLAKFAVQGVVVAPVSWGDRSDGMVRRVSPAVQPSLAELYGGGDPRSASEFAAVLDLERPDVVHFHAMSPAVSVRWLSEARRRGIACVFTHHSATFSCPRGTLLWRGIKPCSRGLRPLECASCVMQGRGVPSPLGKPAAMLTALGAMLPGAPAMLQLWPLLRRRERATAAWLEGMDAVVALCDWSEALLREKMGVDARRLWKLRHAVNPMAGANAREIMAGGVLRLGFFGRADRSKGLALILEAMAMVPELPLELEAHLLGTDDSISDALGSGNEPRLRCLPAIAPEGVMAAMATFDVVLVPSQWMETGPLVLLEALGAGVPVLGSNLGGIAEWLRDDQDGWLLDWNDARVWARAFESLCRQPERIRRWQGNLRKPRCWSQLGGEMFELYQRILQQRGGAPS